MFEDNDYDIKADLKDILFNGIYSINIVSIIMFLASLLFMVGSVMELTQNGAEMANLTGIFSGILAALFVAITSLAGLINGFIKLCGFMIKREENIIFIKYGLLKRVNYAIPVDKVNAVIIGIDDTQGNMWNIKMDMYNVSKGSAKRKTTLTLKGIEDSSALYNSKTLLMNSEKNIIGFPATEYIENNSEYEMADYYLVFSYENGKFHQLKKIKIEEGDTYSTRGLYIDNYLYIVTPNQIQAVNMTNYKIMGKISIK